MQNSTEALHYLEKTQLVVPLGQVPTLGLLMTALHHVCTYQGMPKPAINALQVVAFFMNKLEDSALHQVVRDSVMVQLNELGTDLKDFITDATQHINEYLNNKIAEISNTTKALVKLVMATVATSPSLGSTNVGHVHPPLDYRQALTKPPPHVDPRLAAKEGIKLHQFFLEGIVRDSEIGKMIAAEVRKVVNKAIDKAGGGEHKTRSAIQKAYWWKWTWMWMQHR